MAGKVAADERVEHVIIWHGVYPHRAEPTCRRAGVTEPPGDVGSDHAPNARPSRGPRVGAARAVCTTTFGLRLFRSRSLRPSCAGGAPSMSASPPIPDQSLTSA